MYHNLKVIPQALIDLRIDEDMIGKLIQPNILLPSGFLNYNYDNNNSIKSINYSRTTHNKSSITNESSMTHILYSKITSDSYGLIRINLINITRSFSQ
jgi:hypothetical protein